MISIKSGEEIKIMRKAGKILGDLLDDAILCKIKVGISTKEIDNFVENFIINRGATPILKGYKSYNKVYDFSSCISVNEEVVHGLPSDRLLKEEDVVSVDVCLSLNGLCVDAARTYILNDKYKDMLEVSKKAFYAGFNEFKVGNRIGKVSNAVGEVIETNGYKIIKDFCGHGIGRELHEDPKVLNYGDKELGIIIPEGLTIALEPMLSVADEYTTIKSDGWTAITESGSIGMHWENTIVALPDGPEILTRRFDG